MKDPTSQLRTAARRAKSDVANKLISMFLHELSRTVSKNWPMRVESKDYEDMVRAIFQNRCPYCNIDLTTTVPVIEHLDGMNRSRVGLHIPGNVLVSCRKCNSEKRRDDSLPTLVLASSGWESFLSHDGRCGKTCGTCSYWASVWPEESERLGLLGESMRRIRDFRAQFPELETLRKALLLVAPTLVGKLYSDCQVFAETEIERLLLLFSEQMEQWSNEAAGGSAVDP